MWLYVMSSKGRSAPGIVRRRVYTLLRSSTLSSMTIVWDSECKKFKCSSVYEKKLLIKKMKMYEIF